MKKQTEQVSDNPKYHDTLLLLRKYRDVVWGLELSVHQVKRRFQMEFGSSIEDFLESIYLAGVDFSDNGIEEQARSIEKSYQMLKLLENSINIMRNKHKHGEKYIGCSITVIFHLNSTKVLTRSSRCSVRIFRISANVLFSAGERMPLKLFRQSCGAILPRTA